MGKGILRLFIMTAVFTGWLVFLNAPVGIADQVDMAEDVPATEAEMRFVDRVVGQVKAAVVPLEGWNRDVSVTVSGNTVRDGKPVLIYERARDYPLKINLQLNFAKVTQAQKNKAAEERSAQDLQQEMMAAGMRGDTKKMNELQQQLASMMQAQMTAGAMGQAVGASPAAPAEKPPKFYVQVVVNDGGESIGKKYDTSVPEVTKAFRVERKGNLKYKYYFGEWDVTELDRVNWRVVFPKRLDTAENHLRALTLYVTIYGESDFVEPYVTEHFDPAAFNAILN